MTVFGVHAGLQNTSMASLRALWRQVEDLGFDWISVWDHFYSATLTEEGECHEAVATHAALACDTSKVRCGSLVYSVGYRHPAVLANAISTIDHLSGGRADIGLGAGWSEIEYRAYGIPFPAVKVRLDQLEEAIQCVRGLLRDETTTFKGEWFELHDARCDPKPVQPSTSDLDRRTGREAHAAHRRAVGRRLEHPVRRSRRCTRTSVRCCTDTVTTSDAIPPRSARR